MLLLDSVAGLEAESVVCLFFLHLRTDLRSSDTLAWVSFVNWC